VFGTKSVPIVEYDGVRFGPNAGDDGEKGEPSELERREHSVFITAVRQVASEDAALGGRDYKPASLIYHS